MVLTCANTRANRAAGQGKPVGPCSPCSMPHPCYRPGSYPSCLLAREESDFISPMKLLAAKAVCIVRLCVSPAKSDEEGREDGGAELAVFRKNCSVCPGSQGIPAELRDDKQAGKCKRRLFRLVPLGGVAECQTLLRAPSPARALGRWQARPLLLAQPFRRCWRLLICQPCLLALLSRLSPSKNHTLPW